MAHVVVHAAARVLDAHGEAASGGRGRKLAREAAFSVGVDGSAVDRNPRAIDRDARDLERIARMTVLEVLYTRRRMEPRDPGIFDLDLEGLTGRPREHLEFTLWYLSQKKLIQRGDNSRLTITAEGIDCLEQNFHENLTRKRLKAADIPETEASPSGQPA